MNGVGSGGAGGGGGGGGDIKWSIGLVSSAGGYLTAETFGDKINAASTNMRKKQLWTLEHDSREDDVVYLRSHLGKYLACDRKGNAKCEEPGRDKDAKFAIVYDDRGTGRWAFKNKTHGLYFGGSGDHLKCDTGLTETEWWTVRLAVHPHVNLRNVNRKKYAHLDEEAQQIHVERVIPWGPETLITIEFSDGKYAVKTCNSKYLTRGGELVNKPNADCLFNLEVKSGQHSGLALKDCNGRYLSASGRPAVMQSGTKVKTGINKDDLFTLEDSHAQVFITAHNGKMVSIKQGVDLSANQDELSDRETFQVEFDKKAQAWNLRSADNRYWSLENAQGIQANSSSAEYEKCRFYLDWLDDGHVAIRASNGKYITAKLNGSLYATQPSLGDKELFYITIINRPVLILRCSHGFVGFKTPSNPRIECNKSTYDVIFLEHSDGKSGAYYLKGHNGKYWGVADDGSINADSLEPQSFFLEMREQSRFSIRTPNEKYIKGEQNGTMTAKAHDHKGATLWEY